MKRTVFSFLFTCIVLNIFAQQESAFIETSSSPDTITVLSISNGTQYSIDQSGIQLWDSHDRVDMTFSLDFVNNVDATTGLGFELIVDDEVFQFNLNNGQLESVRLDFTSARLDIGNRELIRYSIVNSRLYILVGTRIIHAYILPLVHSRPRLKMWSINATNAQIHIGIDNPVPLYAAISFEKEQYDTQEAYPVEICAKLYSNWEFAESFTAEVVLSPQYIPHFPDTPYVQLTFDGVTDPCFYLFPAMATECFGTSAEYKLNFTNISSSAVLVGPYDEANLTVSYTQSESDVSPNILYPGDLLIKAIDNDIDGQETDLVTLMSLVPITKGTSFSITNASYANDHWEGAAGLDLASQKITYIGDCNIRPGVPICLNIPATGVGKELFVSRFQINGVDVQSEFEVENDGVNPDPNINIPTDGPSQLFLLQGEWNHQTNKTRIIGRTLSGIGVNGSTTSYPDDINGIFARILTGSPPQSIYAYYGCTPSTSCDLTLNYGLPLSWTISPGSALNDLDSDTVAICTDDCIILDACGACSFMAHGLEEIIGISINGTIANINYPYFFGDTNAVDILRLQVDLQNYLSSQFGDDGEVVVTVPRYYNVNIFCTSSIPDYVLSRAVNDTCTAISWFGTCCSVPKCDYTLVLTDSLKYSFFIGNNTAGIALPFNAQSTKSNIISALENIEMNNTCSYSYDDVFVSTVGNSISIRIIGTNAPISYAIPEICAGCCPISFTRSCKPSQSLTEQGATEQFFERPNSGLLEAGIENLNNAILLYPNPTNSSLNIEFTATLEEIVEIQIYDIRGRLVESIEHNQVTGLNLSEFSLMGYSSGTYLLRIRGEEVFKTKMFVITK
jgi:Secretion system C-terminal sorting domain